MSLLVDSIGDMITADTKDIEKPPANIGEIDGRFMTGVLKMEGKLMIVLKTGALLKSMK